MFSGDVISVAANGSTRIALNGGAQVEVLANSSVRLKKTDEKIQMSVDRGQASFHFSGNSGVSALVADATVRPSNWRGYFGDYPVCERHARDRRGGKRFAAGYHGT